MHVVFFFIHGAPEVYNQSRKKYNTDIIAANYNLNLSAVSGTRFKMLRKKNHKFLRPMTGIPMARQMLPVHTQKCKYWVVVTTIFSISPSVKRIVESTRWCIIIVADKKSQEKTSEQYFNPMGIKFNKDMHFFLSVSDQGALYKNLGIVQEISWNHFGRKNIGYLFAIRHNAELIFDMDDDNIVEPALLPDSIPQLCVGTQDHTIINPYPYFGQKYIWPRGLPLTHAKNTTSTATFVSYNKESCKNIGILQSLADNDADVDAILRLTSHHYPVTFDKRAFVIEIKNGNFAPFNAQATLFAKSCFWALLLPLGVHGRVSDIWRSFIAQTLMKLTGNTLAFSSPWVKQNRTTHDILADFDAEIPLYTQTLELISFLKDWECFYDSFEMCMEQLYCDLYDFDILGGSDVFLVRSWLSDLKSNGYYFPKILRSQSTKDKKDDIQLPTVFKNNETEKLSETILAIVVLNNIDILHRVSKKDILAKFFKYPLSCNFANESHHLHYDVILSTPEPCSFCSFKTLINDWSDHGLLAYNSIIQANHLFPGYKGYLNIHDDFAINYCQVGSSIWDESIAWFSIPYPAETRAQNNWGWWSKLTSATKYHNADQVHTNRFTNLQQVRKATLDISKNMVGQFNKSRYLQELYSKSENYIYAQKGQSDAFFVGSYLIADFNTALYALAKNGIFLEISVPHAAKLSINRPNFVHVPLCTCWDQRRNNPFLWIRPECTTAHPIKLSDKKNIFLTEQFSSGMFILP